MPFLGVGDYAGISPTRDLAGLLIPARFAAETDPVTDSEAGLEAGLEARSDDILVSGVESGW